MIPKLGKDTNRNWIPINDWNPNIEQIAEQCFIGPQGEIMQMINDFNLTYGNSSEPIGITKRFFWKRGTYNNVKDIYSKKINRFNEKPRGMHNICDRINNQSWQSRSFWTKLTKIEDKLVNVRWRGFNWLDNTDTVNTYVTHLKTSVNEGIERNKTNFPDIDIELYIDNTDNDMSNKIILLIWIKNIEIKVKCGGQIIGRIPTEDIVLYETVQLWPHINTHCDIDDPFTVTRTSTSSLVNNKEAYFFNELQRYHPFVSKHSTNRYSDNDYTRRWTNICQGDHAGNWTTALWNLNLDVFLHYVNIWASNYEIPTTNPLNRINTCFYGLPKGVDEEVLTIPSGNTPREETLNSRWHNCKYPDRYLNLLSKMAGSTGWREEYDQEYIFGIEDHCNKCQLQSVCKNSIDLDLYPFDHNGIIVMSFEDNEGLSDIPFIRQQLLMHLTAKDIIERSNFNHILLKPGFNKYCLIEIDEKLAKDAETTEYNLDYWYTALEYRNRAMTTDVMMNTWDVLSSHKTLSWDNLANEYCDLVYGAEFNNLNEDDRYDFQNFSDGLRPEDLFQEIVHHKEMIKKIPSEGVVILEEELSDEDRVIRWAAQRSGAITFNQ